MVAVATVPLYLDAIGIERYGILLIAWLLLGYFGFTDLGLTRATAHHVARLRNGPAASRQALVVTAITINAAVGVVGAAVLYLVASVVLGTLVIVPDGLTPETVQLLPWIAIGVPAVTLTGVLNGALEGMGRFGVVNLIGSVGTSVFQIVPLLVAVHVAPELDVLVASAVLTRYVFIAVLAVAVAQTLPVNWPLPWAFRTWAAELVPYGLWITADKLLGPLLAAVDRVLIGASLGAASVSLYGVPYNLAIRARLLPLALTRAMFPQLSQLSGTLVAASALARSATTALARLSAPIVIAGMIAMHPFLSVWVGGAFAEDAAFLGETALMGMWLGGIGLIPFTMLQACGAPKAVVWIRAVQVVPYVGAMMLGLKVVGLAAAPVVWTLQVAADCALLARRARVGASLVRSIWPPGGLVAAAWLLVVAIPQPAIAPAVAGCVPLILSLMLARPVVLRLLREHGRRRAMNRTDARAS